MSDPHHDDDVQMAASISVVACEHGSVYVRLHDADGSIFAAGCMPAETAAVFADQAADAAEAAETIADSGDTIGECQGHG